MRKVRENIVSSFGNQAVFAAGQSVFNDDGSVAVAPGQYVFYDPKTLQSLGPGTTVDTHSEIVIGIGIDLNGDGVAETVRANYGDKLHGCYIDRANAQAATCGTPEIVDLLFKCVGCGDELGITVKVEDDQTQNEYPYNQHATYAEAVKATCIDCEDCDPGYDPKKAVCEFVEKFNNSSYKAEYGKFGYKKRNRKAQSKGFKAVQLHDTSLWYCLSATQPNGSCENCTHVDGIKAYTIDGGEAVEFTNSLDPANPTLTLQGRLQSIVNELNEALAGDGHAVITSGAGACCDIQLHVNTCRTFTLEDSTDTPITPCQTESPFDPVAVQDGCTNCGTAGTVTFDAGIRFISETIELECGQFGIDNPRGFLTRKLEVFPTDGFLEGATFTRKVQEGTEPENSGYQWLWREYAQDNGGRGREYDAFTQFGYGLHGLPLGKGRSSNYSTASCKENYCSYILEHALPNSDTGVHGNRTAARGRSVFLIPSGDAATIADFEAILNGYVTSSGCPVKAAINC